MKTEFPTKLYAVFQKFGYKVNSMLIAYNLLFCLWKLQNKLQYKT